MQNRSINSVNSKTFQKSRSHSSLIPYPQIRSTLLNRIHSTNIHISELGINLLDPLLGNFQNLLILAIDLVFGALQFLELLAGAD